MEQMVKILLTVFGASLVSKHIKSIWFAIPLAFIAGVVSDMVVWIILIVAFPDNIESLTYSMITGLVWQPVIAIIAFIVFRIAKSKARVEPVTEAQSTERKCPFCAETIKQEAVVCRFCNRDVVPPLAEPVIEVSAEKYLNSIKAVDKATYEKYNQQTEKERKNACFACHGEITACGMCDFRESNLKKYLEAKQAVETTA